MPNAAAQAAAFIETVRDFLADPRRYFFEEVTGRGDVNVYRLQHLVVDHKDMEIKVNGTIATTAEVMGEEGYIRFPTTAPTAGDLITVEGYHWDWWTDDSVKRFASYVVANYASAEGEDRFEDISENQDFLNVMALATAVEMLWSEWTGVSRQIDTASPEVSIPVRQRFDQLGQLLAAKQAELRKAEEALNIGRYKIEMLTLRRISKTTGRYVPIYIGQEFDDWSLYPQRVFPPIDDGTLTPT